jgi:hemerythrin
MGMFEWKPEYSVGYAQIDEQHKRLFELAEEMHNAMTAGKGKQILSKTLSSLIAYTKAHFATEERLMQAYQYPDYASHKAAHDALTAKVVKFEKEFQTAGLSTTISLLPFLRDWLMHHIGETDKKIAAYLNSKNAA